MAPLVKLTIPLRIDRLTHIMRIRSVDVYVHWTVFLVVAIIISNTYRRPLTSIVGLICYFGVMMIHECGHMVIAQRLGSDVESIRLYPIFGLVYFQIPRSRLDQCLIAWGGVLAQAAIAIPIVIALKFFGFTPFNSVNALLVMLGYYSLFVAALNLLPVPPLDGSIAWGIVPAYYRHLRNRRSKRSASPHY